MVKYSYAFIFFITVCFSACKRDKQVPESELFKQVIPTFNNRELLLPDGFTARVLFIQGDTVTTINGLRLPAKGKHDLIVYTPINGSSEHGFIYVNHESHAPDSLLGDGGGGTYFEVKKDAEGWRVIGDFKAIDFKEVGYTERNCGGTATPYGTILTAEEKAPTSNEQLIKDEGFTDTTDLNGRKRFWNYGWMVEIDPKQQKATRKLWQMGRYEHEDAHCMADGKTVYLTADETPAVFFKFVADKVNDYEKGQLYAYRQSADGNSGDWIKLPMEMDSLLIISDVAVRMGATMGVRHEWVQAVGNKLYITETGSDNFNLEKQISVGGKPARHLLDLCSTDGKNFSDPYGRVLELDLETNKMSVLVNGGISKSDTAFCFSNPDGLTAVKINGKDYLVISEDCNGNSKGRTNARAEAAGEIYNEVYFLDLSIKQPKLENLKRFAVGPEGCETTGDQFTPDGKTFFLSIQGPRGTNPTPYNKTSMVAITGFK
jgi:secreted PhoX family phosphatase